MTAAAVVAGSAAAAAAAAAAAVAVVVVVVVVVRVVRLAIFVIKLMSQTDHLRSPATTVCFGQRLQHF